MKLFLRLLKLGCLVFIVLSAIALWTLYTVLVPADPERKRQPEAVEITAGATGADVAAELEKRGLIRSAFGFRLLLRYRGQSTQLRSGYYEIDPSLPAIRIFEKLALGQTLTRKATFPEGLTKEQMAQILQESEVASGEDFLKLARNEGKEFGPQYPLDLEGYLFPDTYEFPWKCSAAQVVQAMLHQFETVAGPVWEKHKAKAPLALKETVILASMVEREAQVDSERPLIAGVYVNRLKAGMPLQCDATVQYALGKPKAVLQYKDLEVESPYNTYKYPGLPPGPICNPGIAALEAAMNPAPSDYLYYVRNDVKGDGSHVFSRTYGEHQQAIGKFQR
ncbi:MAG: endolytic transglycosylase MltG [Armatimonadetes bacterium]|nr:endolytic transglycosylase MltG [Armatimonadota bacterium]